MKITRNSWGIYDVMYTTKYIYMYHNYLPEKFIFIAFCVPSLLIFSELISKHDKITIDYIY